MSIRIAAVGAWHVHAAEYVTELLGLDEVTLTGVFDTDGERAAAFGAEHGLRVLSSLADALADNVDAIVVNTDTASHEAVISAALRAGKHVFTEKVLAPRTDTALALEQLARDQGRVLFVSLQRLAEPWVYEMLDIVGSGAIGRVTASRLRYQHGGVVEGWLPGTFLDPGEACGGSIIDLGAHGYYLSQLFHGAFPDAVTATASFFTGSAVEDHSTVTLTYPGGVTSTLETSLVAGPFGRWCEVYGTHGFAVVDSRDDVVRVRTGQDPDWTPRPNGARRATPLRRFLDAVAAGSADEANVRDALRLTALVEASYTSAAAARTVVVADPLAGLPA